VTFQTGFGVAATLGYSDNGVLQRPENNNAAFVIGEALGNVALREGRGVSKGSKGSKGVMPCIADGDTGHGSAMNIRRTIFNYGKASMAGVMIEDQVSPKRCGHVDGKEVVSFEEAVKRVRIACDARDDYRRLYGVPGPLILARTDARGVVNGTLEEAIRRCKAFVEVGADITFLEAPQSYNEMKQYCDSVPGYKMYNSLEGGKTPILNVEQLQQLGYNIAAYPLTLLSSQIKAQNKVLDVIGKGEGVKEEDLCTFEELKDIVGFGEVRDLEETYNL
jgi:2-methylisocitrate lyase-like PEP mutase family enzyme